MSPSAQTLRAQQIGFQNAIVLQRDELAPALRTSASHENLLRVYQFAYSVRLLGALRDNFAVLPLVMGDEAFDALAHAYVQDHPSRHPSIRWYGQGLVDFMAQRDDLVPHPALVDLARMEWALRTAFDAADAPSLSAASLAALSADDWPRLVFEVHPSLQVLHLAWAIEPVWQASKAAELEGTLDALVLSAPESVEHALMVWREGLETRWRTAPLASVTTLQALMAGAPFAQLCTLAAEHVGEAQAAAAVVGDLQAWLADGWLIQWRLV